MGLRRGFRLAGSIVYGYPGCDGGSSVASLVGRDQYEERRYMRSNEETGNVSDHEGRARRSGTENKVR